MAYDAKTERLISIKKLSGKAQTSNDKGLANEALPSGITMASSTIFGEDITTNPNSAALYAITDKVEYVRFPVSFIAGSDTSSGRHGFELKLPSDYESNSSNTKAGTYPFRNNQSINITSGSLQLVPPSFATAYEAKPYYGGSAVKNSGTQIPVLDARDWYMDYFNGIFFQQDPTGTGDQSDNPDYVEAFLYIGDMLETVVSGSATPGGSNTQIQFNDNSTFSGSSGLTFDKATLTLTANKISGSLTRLADGTSFIQAGSNITVATSSAGNITIASTGGSGTSFSRSKTDQKVLARQALNTAFTISGADMSAAGFDPSYIDMFLNGQLLVSGTQAEINSATVDYTVTGNSTAKFSFDLEIDDRVSLVVYTKT